MNLIQKLAALGAIAFVLFTLPNLVSVPFDYRWFYYAALAVALVGVWLIYRASSPPPSESDGN